MNITPELPPHRAARYAGLAYALLFVLALFANFAVRERMIDTGDAAATVADITGSETLFRISMLAFLVIFVLDVVIAWLLHLVLRESGERRSLLAAWFRIGYTVFLGVAIVFMFAALRLVESGPVADGLSTEAGESLALLALDAFNATWMVGLALFGVHLVVVARILWTAAIAPRWMSVVLTVAGAAYMVDTIGYTVLHDYDDHAGVFTAIVVLPAVIGEAALTFWLLRRGRGEQRPAARLAAAAA